MTERKPFQKLEFHDAFLFAASMEDEELCRMVLERILEIPIRKVKVQGESTFLFNSDYRGIRVDVYADDEEGTVFDVEMQTTQRGNLPKRSRFYQAHMDVGALKPGDDFNKLPRSFVIFICTFDPFGGERYRYTFCEKCIEDGKELEDGTCKVFLNTKGRNEREVSPELVWFLKYVEDATRISEFPEDELLRRIENRVIALKGNRRMEERYMLFGEMLDEERREGREEGIKEGIREGIREGEQRLSLLMTRMEQDGLLEEIPRLWKETNFRQEMYRKYQL